jgi:PAS domain S-box-containing protein
MTSLPHDLAARTLDGSPDAVLVCDRRGTVRYWNRAAERVFGFRASEAVGASMDLIIPERLRARHWAGWEAAIEAGATRYGEGQVLAVPALHKDGRLISIEFSIQLLRGADGTVEWVVAFIRDVTERYRREKQLLARVSKMEETMGHISTSPVTRQSGRRQTPPIRGR